MAEPGPAHGPAWRQPRAVGLGALWLAFLALMWVNQERHEDVLTPLGVLPLVLTGLAYGRRMGVAGALFIAAASFTIHALNGDPAESAAADVRENAFRWTVGVALGFSSGFLGEALRAQRRANAELRKAIAARDAAEHGLAANQRNWQALLANAPDYVLVVDAGMRVQHANRTPAGLRVQDVLGQPIGPFVPDPVERKRLLDALAKAIGGGEPSVVELRGTGPDGQLAEYRCRIVHTLDASGASAALMMNVDVTSQRRTERDLARSEAQFRTLAENYPDYITRVDRDGKRLYSNPKTVQLWKELGAGDPTGTRVGDVTVTPAAAAKDLRDTIAACLADGQTRHIQQAVPLPSGLRHLEGTIVPERGPDGQIESALLVARDVTEAHAGREALQRSEAALRSSEERFRLAAKGTQDVIYDVDVPAARITWGDAMGSTFGHDPATLPRDLSSWTDNLHPDDAAPIAASFDAALAGDADQWQAEYRFRRADGAYADVLDRCFIVRGPDGKALRAVGSMTDITGLRRIEGELRASEARWRSLAEHAPAFILTCDLAGRLTFANRTVAGLRLEDVLGRFAWEFSPGDDAEVVRRAFRHVAATGEPQRLETRGPGPDGSEHWYTMHWSPVQHDGRVTSVVAMAFDITEQRRMEAAARENEERMRALIDNVEEGFITQDVTGARPPLYSQAVERIFGVPMQELVADPLRWLQLVHPDDRGAIQASHMRLYSGHRTLDECRLVRPNGSVRWIRASMVPALDPEGHVVRVDGTIRDITTEREVLEHQRRAEELQMASTVKTQFLNNAAHELATPITPLKLQLATLAAGGAGPLTEQQQQALGLLERNVNRLGTLVNDLLDAARLQGGQLRLNPRPLRLREVVGDAVASFADKARADGIVLAADTRQDIEVPGDATRLSQVLTNLVHNALKFTPRGGQVRVAVGREGDDAILQVQDTGIGLTSQQAARLFQPFQQVHDTSKLQVGGTGLGLYICKGIVEQHGGRLEVRSDGPGHGTTFTVRLPLRAAAPRPGSGATRARPL